jgi:hypothetical protein
MDLLTKSLLQELLNTQKTVAIYGGGFKPPTKGHFAVVKKTLENFPEIDELKIFVGSGVRDGITQDESIKIWEIYKNYLSPKVTIEPSVAPVKSVLGYAKDHPEEKVYWVLGAREDDEDDLKDIESRTRSIDKYPNIEVKVITTTGGISGTKTRTAIRDNNKSQFLHLIPDIDPRQQDQIWGILSSAIKERITPDELKQADTFADKQLAPIDVDLTSKHVLDRLTGRESDVTYAQLIGFFKRLGKNKKEFIEFFQKYDEIVATDNVTNLNIPFVNLTNKAIAKTIMKKDNFKTPNPKLVFEKEEAVINKLKSKIKTLANAVKQESKETKQAFSLLIKASKGDIKLTDLQHQFIKEQMTDLLKSLGLVALAILPAGSLVALLLKALKLSSYVTPSAFINEIGDASASKYKWKEVDQDGYWYYTRFTTDSETEYEVDLESTTHLDRNVNELPAFNVEFAAKPKGAEGSSSKIVVNKGELYKVMATIVDIIKHYVKKDRKKAIMYSPEKKQGEDFGKQRDMLYKAFIRKAMPGTYFETEGDWIVAILPNKPFYEINNTSTSKYKKEEGINKKPSSDPFGLNALARQVAEEVGRDLTKGWNPQDNFVSLSQYMIDNGMNIKPLPKIKVIKDDKENASDLLGKTAYYDPSNKSITLYTFGRHPKDVLRSFAHEMVHHEQNLNGKLDNITTTNTNEGGDLPEIEKEAYEKGNMMLRNWEDKIKSEKYIKEYKQYALTELFEKDLPNIKKLNNVEYLVGNGIDIEAKYYFRLDDPSLNKWSIHWNFTNNNKNISPEAWKQVTTTSFKVLKDFISNKKPKYISISGNESKSGRNTKLNIYKSKSFLEKLENIFNNQYLIKNDDESMVLMKSIEEAYKHAIHESVKYGGERYEDALHYWQNLDTNAKSKIERWSAIKRKAKREVLQELYGMNSLFLDIPKFNYPKTFTYRLRESLNEITLSKDNAVEIS